jgi:hypothetical protein
MGLIWEREEKNTGYFLLKGPLTFLLVVINSVLASWILHVSFSIFTDAQDHMSIYEWIGHLYALLP